MFNGNFQVVNSPCKGCENRCATCHCGSNCQKWVDFQKANYKQKLEFVKSREGLGGIVARKTALIG